MPIENRSSNTEMVSVARGLIEQLEQFGEGSTPGRTVRKDALEQLYACCTQPAPQPHPDPVAWMVGTAFWWTKEEAERDAPETGLPIVGLGPMPDTGVVDQLSQIIRDLNDERDGIGAEAGRLRAQLAKRDALLGAIAGWTAETRAAVLEAFQDELSESASYAWYDAAIADLMKLIEPLSASAEPSEVACRI